MNEKIIAIIGIGLCILFLVFGIFNTVKVNRVKRELQSVIESNQRINEELETARRIISELITKQQTSIILNLKKQLRTKQKLLEDLELKIRKIETELEISNQSLEQAKISLTNLSNGFRTTLINVSILIGSLGFILGIVIGCTLL